MEEKYQTPGPVADYMASLLPKKVKTVLEPTPGAGNLLKAVYKVRNAAIVAPDDFYKVPKHLRFDAAIMNPPFTPMQEGFEFLTAVMKMTDNIVALLPWFILINSEKRLKHITDFGLVSITSLPRKTFPECRIQTCVIVLKKNHKKQAIFKTFNW